MSTAPRRGRPPKASRSGSRPSEEVTLPITSGIGDEEDDEGSKKVQRLAPLIVKRGRGRPPRNPKPVVQAVINEEEDIERGGAEFVYDYETVGASGVPSSTMRRLAKCLPRMEIDGEVVQCSDCSKQMTVWQFRLHNIQCHVNTAPTTAEKDEGLVMDHKYFARKLNEFKRLTKMVVFACPREGCKSSFKSTLGLAYHMNTCGRSKEELEAVLLECEVCHERFTLPNLAWHRKIHEEKRKTPNDDSRTKGLGHKRKSALAARKSFKKLSSPGNTSKNRSNKGDEDEWNSNSDSDDDDDEDGEVDNPNDEIPSVKRVRHKKRSEREKPILDLDSNDYTVLALEFLEALDDKGYKAWDDPPRFVVDPFLTLSVPDNPLIPPSADADLNDYLPSHKTSVEFMCTTGEDSEGNVISTTNYHCLNWFEGETVEMSSYSSSSSFRKPLTFSASVHHTGGPVLSMAWHPSGKLLAVSVGHSFDEELDSLVSQERKSCIQIYRRAGSVLSLQLVLGVRWGYATHIQWSTFSPDIMDSYNPCVESCFDDIEIYARLGYLAMCSEDAVVRILSLGIQDLKVPPNFEYKPPYKIKVYTKTPEIELRVDESVIEDPLGNAIRFDWHDANKYFAVGYANGFIAVYDLQSESPLLVHKGAGEAGATVINPFWTFHGHLLGVRALLFDPMNPRYFVSCSQDRQMKVWDLDTRMERDTKRPGICLDMCWVRGWMHQVVSFENIVSYQSAMHNYVRIFQMGSTVGKPSSAEIFNVTSVDFFHGLTAQGTDDGKVHVTYYDWFWRDCDFERNRKKKNLAVLSTVEVDKASYTPFSAEDFSVQVKKLNKAVLNSKLYQRLGVNEEEGIYSVSLEAKFGDMNIFEPLPNIEEDGEEEDEEISDGEGEEEIGDEKPFGSEEDTEQFNELALTDAINNAVTKGKDGLIPIYDVRNPEGAPRLNISLSRNRPGTAVPAEGLEVHQVEEYIRFHTYLRINKVAWSPSGDVVAVGYRNGLITLLPGSFESIFP